MRRKRNSTRKILVVTSDWHSGHRLGLMNPETPLYEQRIDGKSKDKSKDGVRKLDYTLSEFQRYLWNTIWIPSIKEIKHLADGDPIGVIVNGDITHGMAHIEQLVSNSTANQFLIAEGVMKPWLDKLDNLKMLRFAFGTASHNFYEGTSSILVSELMKPKYPKVNMGVVHHGLLDIQGVNIDYAHHGPSQGIRDWTEGNQLRYYLKSIMAIALKNGIDPPDAVFRSHYHYPHKETVNTFIQGDNGRPRTIESRIYLTPSMCGMNDYAHQATRSTPFIYNGFMVLEIENGRIINDHLDDFVWMLDLRTKETW